MAKETPYSLSSYVKDTEVIVSKKEEEKNERKCKQRERLERLSIDDHTLIINAIIQGHTGAEFIKIRYAITDMGIELCAALVERYQTAGWYANYDPFLTLTADGYDNSKAIEDFKRRNPVVKGETPLIPGGIIIASAKNPQYLLSEEAPPYRKRPYLCYRGSPETDILEIDFFLPPGVRPLVTENLILFGEYIVVELRNLSIPVEKVCLNTKSGYGPRLPEVLLDI